MGVAKEPNLGRAEFFALPFPGPTRRIAHSPARRFAVTPHQPVSLKLRHRSSGNQLLQDNEDQQQHPNHDLRPPAVQCAVEVD